VEFATTFHGLVNMQIVIPVTQTEQYRWWYFCGYDWFLALDTGILYIRMAPTNASSNASVILENVPQRGKWWQRA
jgi:hypothetical protein